MTARKDDKKTTTPSADELLAQIRTATQTAETIAAVGKAAQKLGEKTRDNTLSGHTTRQVGLAKHFGNVFVAGCKNFWNSCVDTYDKVKPYGGPPLRWLGRAAVWTGQKYKEKIWDRFAYNTAEDGARSINWKKAGVTAVLSLTAAFFGATHVIAPTAVNMAQAGFDGAVMSVSGVREVKGVFNKASPIPGQDDAYEITGCRVDPAKPEAAKQAEGGCSQQDSLYTILRPSWAHEAYSLASKGTLFLEKNLAASIVQGAQCTLKVYAAKPIKIGGEEYDWARQIKFFPKVLDVNCTSAPAATIPHIPTPPVPLPTPAPGA